MNHTLILFFNSMWGQPLTVDGFNLPEGCELTTDRKRFEEAAAVVFHIPDLGPMASLTKHPGQIWAAWSMECDLFCSRLQDPQFMKQFDLTMTYHVDADVPVTYVPQEGTGPYETFRAAPEPKTKDNLAALFLSSHHDGSGRTEYLTELMRYLDIHAYGRQFRNRTLNGDQGRATKLATIAGYKFTLCFENALSKDYVTEKFFDPLLAGSVPVYHGAPNIDAFAPGKNCFINIAHFENPKKLSQYLKELNEDDASYETYHAWRQKNLATGFIRLRDQQREPAFVRLCRKVLELKNKKSGLRAMASFPGPPSPSNKESSTPEKPGHETGIPKILHQTWKDQNLPPDLLAFRHTWLNLHPDWECRLWTDADNRDFLERHYSWFLPIYDHYPEHIMRVDAVRYFMLFHYGGVYADLDVECLRPLAPLLREKQVVFGLENRAHLETDLARERSLAQIVGNAIMASVPRHPFWETVFKQLVACHRFPGPLDATGPFMMTRAYEAYSDKKNITLESSERLYPISNETPWPEIPEKERALILQTAHVIHHWQGSWWRKPNVSKGRRSVKVSLLVKGETMDTSMIDVDKYLRMFQRSGVLPRVSCLMVTKNRPAMACQAINCFLRQTYPNRELVIIDDGKDDTLQEWIEGVGDARIVYIRQPDEGKPLGEQRNLSAAKAGGMYVTQWDDDDLSDPQRLEVQMAVIHVLKTDCCFLERHQIWWPETGRLALSTRRVWEGSFVCAKDKLPPYPPLRKGEDTPVIKRIVKENRTALLDFPSLYVYRYHGENTFDAPHWEQHWQAATKTYEKDAYSIQESELQKRFGAALTLPAEKPDAPFTGTLAPKVLILIPVKDAVPFLPHLWENLKALTYPHNRISLAFLESDSIDDTYASIQEELPALNKEFARVRLFKKDYDYRAALPRWDPGLQYKRRSILARSRNRLLHGALTDEDWVLWLDVDVARRPDDVIEQLLAARKEIVVPNCLSVESGETFDYNTFKLKPGAGDLDWSPYMIDGILQPPKGYGRLYLSDLRHYDCVEIDAVGGTMLLILADIHREGLVFPTFSFKGHIETEGLALMARDMGYRCWGLPHLEIFHP